jgi:hypothetical protein
MVASQPTCQGVRAVIDRIISDDDTLAGWMSGSVHRWPAPVLDEALDATIVNRRGRALAKLLRQRRGTGFPESWMRQIRREASWTRARNTDTSIAGRDADDSLRADLTQSQHALLDRLERLPDDLVQRLAPPVVGEDGGLSGALEAALFSLDKRKISAELALVRRLSESLSLSPEATGALLQVTSEDRFPIPFPLLGTARRSRC